MSILVRKGNINNMDLLCTRCGEPWEYDYVQHEFTAEARKKFLTGLGCDACQGKPAPEQTYAMAMATVLMDISGDDLDCVAAELQDLGLT